MEPDSDLPGGGLLGLWLEAIQTGAIQLVKTATSRCEASVLEWHRGSCRLAQNRDLADPALGTSRTICGFNPKKAADSTVLVGRMTDSGAPLAESGSTTPAIREDWPLTIGQFHPIS